MSWKLAISLVIAGSVPFIVGGVFHERISAGSLRAIQTPGKAQYWKDLDSAKEGNDFPAANQNQTSSSRMQILSAGKPSILFANPALSFEANLGQAPAPVKFLAKGRGYVLSLLPDEVVLNLSSPTLPAEGALPHETSSLPTRENFRATESKLHFKLAGGNPNPAITAFQELSEKSFYYVGNDSGKWQSRIPNYRRVGYRDVYPGVDLIYYGKEGRLESDFVVAPGADPKSILLEVQGARKTTLDERGNLILATSSGRLELQRPLIYQTIGKERRLVAGNYRRLERNRIGFKVGSYDSSKPLIIDPVLSYTTYVGRSLYDRANGIALGPDGTEFVTGVSPKPGSTTGTSEAFVAHLSAGGSQLLYLVYLGGSDGVEARGIAVDAAGNAYITGETHATDFPTLNPLQASCSLDASGKCSGDAFVTKLHTDGSIEFSTYLGGSGEDGANAIAVDATGDVYIAGVTASTNFPVFKPAQATTGGNGDAFVAKISSDGMHVLYATYVGGAGKDEARGIALDGAGNVFITGQTYSHDFPTQNALQRFCQLDALNKCNGEAFVSKLSADGSSLHYSTYLGGSGGDAGNAIAVDAKGSAYVAGATLSADFPTLNPIQAVANGRKDAFVAKLSPDGSALTYSTYLGGSGDDEAAAIAVAPSGVIVVAGRTFSPDYPVRSSIQSACHKDSTGVCSQDAFVTVIDHTGARLEFSSYLGGSGADEGRGIALDGNENVFLAGTTTSTDFPMAKSAIIPSTTVRSAADTASATGLGTTGTIGGAFAARLSGLPGLGKNSPSQKPQLSSATSCSGSNSWTGTAGNNLWTSPTNWSSGSVPVSTDSVCIGTSFVGTTIAVGSLAAANQIIASLVSNADLSITGGPLAVTGTSNFVNNLFLSGGTLALNGAASVGGNTTISAGILGGTGTTTLSGLLTWTGGEMCSAVSAGACQTGGANATTNLNAGMTVTAGALLLSQRTLDNGSTVTFSGASANFEMANGAIVNNQAGSTWDLQDDSLITNIGGVVPAFNNAGTFKKSGGVGISTIGAPFNNNAGGTVLVSAADLRMSAGGNCGSTCTGTYTANTPGTLEFLSGIYAESGAMNGTGTVTFDGGTMDFGAGVETISMATVNFSAGILAGAAPGVLNFSTALNWTGGEMCSAINASGACLTGVTNATTNVNGGMKVTAGALVLSQRTLDNGSTVTFSGASANFEMANGAIVNNQAGSTWDLQDDSLITNIGGVVPAFNNAGTFKKSGGVGISTIGAPFNNNAGGTVLVSAADLRMSAGGNCGSTCTGTYTANTPGTLEFLSGIYAESGAMNGTGTVTFDGGTMDFGAGVETISMATVNFSAGILAGAAPGVLNFSTALNWTGGEMCSAINASGACLTGVTNATTNVNGGMKVTAGALVLSQRTLDNGSTVTFSGASANFEMANGAVVNNQTGATWDLQDDSLITNIGGVVPAFNNAGTFKKSGGVGISTIGAPFNNNAGGTVLVSAADLRMSAGGNCGSTCTGTYTANTPGTLEFLSGIYAESGAMNGTGTVTFDGGTMDFGAGVETISMATVNFSAGILAGAAPGVLNFSTALNWTGGEMCSAINASGACLTGVTNATTNVNGGMKVTAGALVLSQRTLVTGNSSASTFSGSNANFEMANGAIVNNQAGSTWDLQDDSLITNIGGVVPAFNNAGTFKKSGGTTTSTVSAPFANTGSVLAGAATLSFSGTTSYTQTAGSTTINGGSITFSPQMLLQGGTLQGIDPAASTGITGGVSNTGGILHPGLSPGKLSQKTNGGNYSQNGVAAAFNVTIAGTTPGTGYSQFSSDGTVTLSSSNSVLNVILANGFVPSGGDLYTIITAATSVTGTFATTNLPPLPGNLSWTVTYTPTTVVLGVIASPLTSITVAPANPSVQAGNNQQFTATATYANGFMQDITTSVTWASSNAAGATISNAPGTQGLAKAGTSGQVTTISATQGAIVGQTQLTVTAATLTSITAAPTSPSITKGQTQQFTATGHFSDGTTQNLTASATWSSSLTTVATINAAGLATGVGTGMSNITAAQNGVTSNTAVLTVTAATLTSITVAPTSPSITKGQTQQFTATGHFSDGTTQNLTASATWSSSLTTVATINAAGLATGVGTGMSNITAAQNGVTSNTAVLTVTAATLTSIAVAPTSPSITKGQTQQFTATGHFSDGTTQDLTATATWSSSLTTVATINAAGLATGVGTGMSNITAAQNGVTSNTAVLTVTAATLTSITVAPTSPSITKGQTQQFTATGHFSDGTTQDLTATATWSSSLTTVATINAAGLATGVGTGMSNITAAQNGVTSNTAVLTVTAATLTSITVAPTSPSITKGQTQQFTATGHFSDGTTQNLTATATWSSSLTTVATINAAGLATGVGTGMSNITAAQNGVTSNTAVLTVTAATLTSITVAPTSPSITKGQTQQFTATGHFSDGTTQDLTASATWSSSLTTVATINAAGLATGVGTGMSNITAAQNGVTSNTAVLTVTAATLTSITVAPTSPSITKGQTQQFTATGHFSDGTTQDLTASATWSSSLTTVATINAAGLATGVGTGMSNITAAQNGVTSNTAVLTVTAATLTSITVAPTSPSITKGQTQQFAATGHFSDGTTQDLTASATWSSSLTTVATINAAGLATGVGTGMSNITAAQNGVTSNTAVLTVTAATLTSITVAPTSPSITKGQTQQFTATGHFSDGTTQNLTASATWSSSLTTVATINAAGLATGVGTGMSNITAAQNGVTSNTAVLTVTAATLTSITVAPTSPSITKGQTQQFTATGHFSDGTTQNLTATATWSSSLTTVATINAAGLATGVGTGMSNITAAQNGVTSNTAVLTVTAATLTSITVAPTSPSITKGQTQQFTATGHFSDGTTQNLTATATWSSSLTTVATINAAGLATGVGTGMSNITAAQNGVTSNTAVLTVTAATLTSITVAPTSPSITKGQTQQFTATGHFSDGTTQDLTATATWSSSLTTVATINPAGLATGVGTGVSNITAAQNGVTSNTAVLTVTAATLTSITVAPTSPSITKGQTQQFTATGHFSDGTTQNLTATATWSSSLTTVATINAAGLATGVGTGMSNITAAQNGVTSNTAVLTVTAATLTSITVAPTSPSITKGQTQQFTATGHFSDGTTQDLTATATWSSSLTTVATINPAGLATGVGTGVSNITAAQNGVTSNTAVLTVTAATLTSITVAPTSPSITKGQTQQFTATGHFSDGTTQDLTATATWSSSLTTVATINAAGLATGVGTGVSNITAAQNGVTSNTAVLTVTAATLTSITVAPTSPSITKGQTQQFTATGHFSDGTTQNLTATATWSSSLTTVATINAAGLATGVGTGMSNITAAQNGVTSNTAVLTVTAATLTSISVAPTSPSIAKGQTQQFTATGHFSDGTTQNLTASATWSSSLTTVATINAAGLATGVGTGMSNITAAQNGVTSNTAVLTVTAATLTSISVAPTSPSITKGQTQQFTATGHFSDGTTQDLTATATWSSSLTTVATINAAGLATGVGTGMSNITATQNGVTSNTAVLTVAACVSNLTGRGTPSGRAPATIDVTWTGIPSAVSFNVLRATVSGGPYTLLGNAALPAFSDTNGLVNGGTYDYVVQPINSAGGVICQSNEAAITIPNQPR